MLLFLDSLGAAPDGTLRRAALLASCLRGCGAGLLAYASVVDPRRSPLMRRTCHASSFGTLPPRPEKDVWDVESVIAASRQVSDDTSVFRISTSCPYRVHTAETRMRRKQRTREAGLQRSLGRSARLCPYPCLWKAQRSPRKC
jgi:hypothetical protein